MTRLRGRDGSALWLVLEEGKSSAPQCGRAEGKQHALRHPAQSHGEVFGGAWSGGSAWQGLEGGWGEGEEVELEMGKVVQARCEDLISRPSTV